MSSDTPDSRAWANPGYVLDQLTKALETASKHTDKETRERAAVKAGRWRSILRGMLTGALRPGERTPIAGVPAWVTPRVVQGGFATGEFMAGGPVLPHETLLAARLGIPLDEGEDAIRGQANAWFLTEGGRAELTQLLANGRYRIEVPEEGALLAVTWLIEHDDPDGAREVLEEIGPWISRLRFYPIAPDDSFTAPADLVRLQSVGDLKAALNGMTIKPAVRVMRETLTIWNPISDRVVALLHETVSGEAPRQVVDACGKPIIEGGWPCQNYPSNWHSRAKALLAEIATLRQRHKRSSRPDKARSNLAKLCQVLRTVTESPERLTGRQVGLARAILAQIAAKRGAPGSATEQEVRAEGLAIAQRVTKADCARVVAARLSTLPEASGLAAPAVFLGSVSAAEARRHSVPEGTRLAAMFGPLVQRAWEAPIELLIERGIIGSSEMLAGVVSQLSGHAVASNAADVDLRRLMGAVYEAFRRRRTLLLLNLQSQVRFSELPWVKATAPARTGSPGTRNASRELLERIATLAITRFPETILPNRMVRELDALTRSAGLEIPLVEELAADIFTGEVTPKFLAAAKWAGDLMAGTLYERYYGLEYAIIAQLAPARSVTFDRTTAKGLVDMCIGLAGAGGATNGSVARNGRIIEQIQIATTHNLAPLISGLGLRPALQPQLGELAARCLDWIIAELSLKLPPQQHHARLIRRKNAAYAWRQMVVFLALSDRRELDIALSAAQGRIAASPHEVRIFLAPFIEGVKHCVAGGALGQGDSRRFLGWL
jgi:hypothetical protein